MDISTSSDIATKSDGVDLSQVRLDSSFGFTLSASSYHRSVTKAEDVLIAFRDAEASGRKIVLRGHGRSYGDSSLGSEAISLDLTRFNAIESLDQDSGVLVAQAGASLADIWRYSLPDGWWLPVVSGTMKTSLAGAISANIHGKNNVHSGTFGEHLLWIEVASPSGGIQRIERDHPDFWAFVGGWGQLGFVLRAAIQMVKLSSGNVSVIDIPTHSLAELLQLFDQDSQSEYQVAWLDGFSGERGIYSAAAPVASHEPLSLNREYQEPSPLLPLGFRRDEAWKLLQLVTNRPGMKFLSWLKWFVAAKRPSTGARMVPLITYHFPLDYVSNWERAYRPGSLIQFQVAIPTAKALAAFTKLLALTRDAKLEPYLAVIKRHRPAPGTLPYLADGFSIALDFRMTARNRSRMIALFRQMTDLAFDFDGRFYLAKDAFMTAEDARRNFQPNELKSFLDAKRRYDPLGLISSDQFRRLKIAPQYFEGL